MSTIPERKSLTERFADLAGTHEDYRTLFAVVLTPRIEASTWRQGEPHAARSQRNPANEGCLPYVVSIMLKFLFPGFHEGLADLTRWRGVGTETRPQNRLWSSAGHGFCGVFKLPPLVVNRQPTGRFPDVGSGARIHRLGHQISTDPTDATNGFRLHRFFTVRNHVRQTGQRHPAAL